MRELKHMTLQGVIRREAKECAGPRKDIIVIKTLKEWIAAKALLYAQGGKPEIANAYQQDFDLTDHMIYGQMDKRTGDVIKNGRWFDPKHTNNRRAKSKKLKRTGKPSRRRRLDERRQAG